MPQNYVNSATNNDAALYEFADKTMVTITELESPGYTRWKEVAKKVVVNQKGISKVVNYGVRTKIKMGAPSMDYPGGSVIDRIRQHAYPVERVQTIEYDKQTYEDFRKGGENTVTTIDNDLRIHAKGFGRMQELFYWGTGDAKLATLTSASTDTILNLDTVSTGVAMKAYGASQLKEGVPYDLISAAGAVIETAIEITAGGINTSTNAVTLTAAMGSGAPAAGTFLVPSGSYNWAPRGMAYMLAYGKTGSWYGIPMSGKPEFQTPGTDAGGLAISSGYIEKALSKHGFRSGKGMNPSLKIKTSPTQISLFKGQGWNLFRFTEKNQGGEYNPSFKNARYEDEIFAPYPLCDPDAVYFHDERDAIFIEQTPLGIYRVGDDGAWHQKTGTNGVGKGVYYVQYGCVDNNLIEHPEWHVVIRNLEVDATAAATVFNYYNS